MRETCRRSPLYGMRAEPSVHRIDLVIAVRGQPVMTTMQMLPTGWARVRFSVASEVPMHENRRGSQRQQRAIGYRTTYLERCVHVLSLLRRTN